MRIFITSLLGVLLPVAVAAADPLHDAARAGDRERVVEALQSGANIAKADNAGEPALLIAALVGHRDIVGLLLDRGTDIEIRNKGGLTALHAAAYGGHLDIVELLVSRGADVNDAKNYYHMSPLHAAAEEGRTDVVAFLLAHKADIEAKERNGYTPLTQAGWRSHWDTAQLLLKAGAVCQEEKLVGDWLYRECTKRR